MPQIFQVGSYVIYFWTNEGEPLEPIHIHINKGVSIGNAAKILNTKTGRYLLCNNTKIPDRILRNKMDIIEARSHKILNIGTTAKRFTS